MTTYEAKRNRCNELAKAVRYEKVGATHVAVEDDGYRAWSEAVEELKNTPCVTIKDYRLRSSLSAQAVSDRTGIPMRVIQRYESGESKVGNMTVKSAIALAKVYGIDLDDLENLMLNES